MRRPPFKRGLDRGIPTQRLADLLQCPAGRHYAVGDAAWQAGAASWRSVGCPRAAESPRPSRCAAGVACRDPGVHRANAGRGHELRPNAALQGLARGAASPDGGVAVPLLLAMASLMVAIWGAPRLAYGTSGWLRHLPAGDTAHRRALAGGLALAQAPVVVLWVTLWAIAATSGIPTDASRPFAACLLAAGVAMLALPCRNLPLLLGGLIATAGAVVASWLLMGFGLGTILLGDVLAGPIDTRYRPSHGRPVRSQPGARALPLRIIWRALPGRWGLSYAPAGLCLAISALFIRNNTLAPADASVVVRLGGGLAVVGSTALLAKLIAARRPPWPWARSLPRSSLRRVGEDATFLALAALPVIAVSSVMNGYAAASLVLMLPYIVVRAAVALRAADSPLGGDVVFVELMLAVGVLTLIPSLAFVSVAALPVAVAHAVRVERRHRAGRWTETDHLGRGDTQAWSGQ